jgi:transcriptional regulator with XRE-family HTH domain
MIDESFAERLKVVAQALGLKQHNIYKDMGTSSARVSNVFNGVNNPSYDFLQNFLSAYPNVNANWLLKGEGEMFLDNSIVREPDVQKWSSTDLRKRIDRMEAYMKKKFDDFE